MSEFPVHWHNALAVLVAILLVFVPIEQILTLKILLRVDNRPKRLTPFLINLAVANLTFVFFNLTLSVPSHISRRYVADKPVCIFTGYLASAAVIVTFATFSACTVIVYNATNDLTTTSRTNQRRKDIGIIIGLWIVAFAILSPLIPYWAQETFSPDTSGCTPMRPLLSVADIAYFGALIVVSFSIPLCISLVYSVKIYLLFVRIQPFHMSFLQQRRYHENKNISKMMIASVFVFVACWAPFTIEGLVRVFGHTPSPALRAIPYLLSKSSVLYTPIIYAIFNAKFRAAIVSLFHCCKCRKKNRVNVYRPPLTVSRHVSRLPENMEPRSPVVNFEKYTRRVGIHEERSVSYDSIFNVPRYKGKLVTFSAGLKIYSLDE